MFMENNVISKKTVLLIIILSILVPKILYAQYTEYEIKAAYLEKFTRFIEWPVESSLSDTAKPFVIGVINDFPFSTILKEIYKERKIKNRKVLIIPVSGLNNIQTCNLLFISESKEEELFSVLSLTKGRPILTISDTKGFAEKGVLINLYTKLKRIGFEMNETAFLDSGLSPSYLLFNIAKIVNPKGSS